MWTPTLKSDPAALYDCARYEPKGSSISRALNAVDSSGREDKGANGSRVESPPRVSPLRVLQGHEDAVLCVRWSSDSARLVSSLSLIHI